MAKILIVDDDPDIVESIQVVLESHSYEVFSASTGEEGLRMVKQVLPDLILLDVMMETGRKGLEVAQEIRKDSRFAALPILILTSAKERTGFDFRKDAVDEDWLPVDEYCNKPLKSSELLEKVKKLLKGKV